MAIIKSAAVYLVPIPNDIPIGVNRVVAFNSKITKVGQSTEAEGLMMPVFRFPALLYGSALSTGSGASEQKASDQLEQAQEVSADPRQLLQVWA